MKKIILIIAIVVIMVLIASSIMLIYNQSTSVIDMAGSAIEGISVAPASIDSSMKNSSYIGYSVGGAKDIQNFRENIKNGYFPISTDITYNGIFYDYMFDTGVNNKERTGDEGLFFPTYSTAISKDPSSNDKEYYMTVGLNSNIKEEDFVRKKLNLLVLLDISGSMGSRFNSYYYDGNNSSEKEGRSKMELADESLCLLIDNLKEDDRFGLVTFESNAETLLKITDVSKLDIPKLKEKIMKIEDNGGTDFSTGYIRATSEFENFIKADKSEYENRIIIITDAMPNTGVTSSNSLMQMVKNNSSTGIYTTFVGVGVDFNTKLIEEITDVKGANYYSVHNAGEFEKRLGEEFEYMVTPLVFDLSLDFSSNNYEIEKVYGSDTANAKTGNIMHVNTLFPSKSEGGEVKGGIILLKLRQKSNKDGEITVNVSYKDRNGEEHNSVGKVTFKEADEYFDNTGIRKGIMLTRYVNILKNWILYERSNDTRFLIARGSRIIDCIEDENEIIRILGEHERTSVKLSVSDKYKEILRDLKDYMENENKALNDKDLKQEFKILEYLINYDGNPLNSNSFEDDVIKK